MTSAVERQAEHARSGYWFWGPMALAILAMEILGVGRVQKWLDERFDITVPWPTISTTVSSLAERWPIVYVAVVGLIAAVGFYALTYPKERQTERGRTKRPGPEPKPFRLYNALTGFVLAGAAGWGAILLFDAEEEKLRRGYFVWGILALYGVIVPSLLPIIRREARFPTLFSTFRSLRGLHPVVAAVVGAGLTAGLAILVFHLALYPWPNITNDPNRYAGLKALEARDKAVRTIRSLGTSSKLTYSTQTRGIDRGGDAWLVYFIPTQADSEYSGCSIAVTKEEAVPTPECKNPALR